MMYDLNSQVWHERIKMQCSHCHRNQVAITVKRKNCNNKPCQWAHCLLSNWASTEKEKRKIRKR